MSKTTSGLPVQLIVAASVAWAVLSLLFFLLFSVPLPGQGRPEWYGISTYVLETVAILAAALLCLRNWRSPQIVSGRTVWLLLGLGMLSYFVGNLLLGQWEIGWGNSPDVSPADLFFLLMYVLVGIGMVLAIASRRLNLAPLQWVILLGIGVLGIVISWFIYNSEVTGDALRLNAPAYAQESPAEAPAPAPEAPADAPLEAPAVSAPEPNVPMAADESASRAPAWAISLDEALAPYSDIVGLFYVVSDILLLLAASALLLAFWGGRFSQSWRFIAAAAICFYIADMWFLYATSNIEDYQTGALPEVFWIFSGCLFAIGAALEYDLSGRSRRTTRRRA